MLNTRFTRLVGCTVPIQQAAMGPANTVELAAAVNDAGGLGMISGAAVTAAELATTLERMATITERPFGVDFIVPMIDREALEVAIATAPLIEFFYGQPVGTLVELAHEGGARVSWQVGSALRNGRQDGSPGLQLAACFTSAPILASTSGLSSRSA
jgi:nitronate monooxygenase